MCTHIYTYLRSRVSILFCGVRDLFPCRVRETYVIYVIYVREIRIIYVYIYRVASFFIFCGVRDLFLYRIRDRTRCRDATLLFGVRNLFLCRVRETYVMNVIYVREICIIYVLLYATLLFGVRNLFLCRVRDSKESSDVEQEYVTNTTK